MTAREYAPMPNGNTLHEIRSIVSEGKNISPSVRDRLILAALVDIGEKVEVLGKLTPWVLAWKWLVLILGPAAILGLVSLLVSLLTHQATISAATNP